MKANQKGFTLLELLLAVAIIGILAATAIPQFSSYRVIAFDRTAQSDLRNAMTAIEGALAGGQALPGSPTELALYGHRLSPGVSFTRYELRTVSGARSVHMHTKHSKSPNSWHADYPANGVAVEIR